METMLRCKGIGFECSALFKKWIVQGMFEYWWQWSSRVGTFNIQEKQETKILGKDPEYKWENWPLKGGNAFSVLKNRRIN